MEYKYWIVISPYVYVVCYNDNYLLYNTMNGKHIEGDDKEIAKVITKLTMDNAHWMCPITEDNDSINHFVNDIKEKFIGDQIEARDIHSAVQSYPIKNIQRDIKRYKGNIDYNTDNNIIRYVHELSIYINSDCPSKCKNCDKTYKQYLFCHKNAESTSINKEALLSFLRKEKLPSLYRINILGGNIWEYDNLSELRTELLSFENISLYLYTNIFNFDPSIINKINPREYIVVLVEVNDKPIKEKFFAHEKIQYQFFVSSNKAIENIYEIIETYRLCNYQMKPLYIGNNDEFFRQNVYINKDDIFAKIHSFDNIFRNGTLNCNYFGHLYVMADGLIYSNIDKKPLGSINKDNIDDIIRKELQYDKTWFKIRNNIKPCKSCLFNNLCPPLSNIEKSMRKNDLCLINKEK